MLHLLDIKYWISVKTTFYNDERRRMKKKIFLNIFPFSPWNHFKFQKLALQLLYHENILQIIFATDTFRANGNKLERMDTWYCNGIVVSNEHISVEHELFMALSVMCSHDEKKKQCTLRTLNGNVYFMSLCVDDSSSFFFVQPTLSTYSLGLTKNYFLNLLKLRIWTSVLPRRLNCWP